jgi:hypothetical protein
MTGIVWAHQEVILVRANYVGEYKGAAVLELSNVLLPIRTIPEVRESTEEFVSFLDTDCNAIVENKFIVEYCASENRDFLKTFR